MVILCPLLRVGSGLSRCRTVSSCRYEVSFSAIHGEQIRHHLPGYGQGRSVSIPLLHLLFMDYGQLVVLSRSQFRGFDQYMLDH